MVGGGFEPPKAKPTDLQSAPFDRFGTPPCCSRNRPVGTTRTLLPRLTQTRKTAAPWMLERLVCERAQKSNYPATERKGLNLSGQ